jgi:hypothetical protein
MNKKPLVILSLILAILFVSCSQGGKTGLLVPKEAEFVLHINAKSLSSKLPWEEVKNSEWFKEAMKTEKDTLAERLLNNPASSGVSMESDFVIFLAQHSKLGYVSIQGSLSDAAAFENTLKSAGKDELKMDLSGDLKYASPSRGEEALVAWNKDRFIILSNAPYKNMGGRNWGGDSEPRMLTGDTLKKLANSILSLKGDDLLDNDKRFASLIAETGDMHMWSTASAFTDQTMGMVSSMMKLGALLEGNIGATTISFENGKIVMDGRQYFGDEMNALVKKHSTKNIDAELINHLPSGDVIAAGAFNFPPDGITDLVKLIGMDGMANGFLGEYGYSLQEFAKANKGNIVFAVSDFGVTKDSMSYEGVGGKTEYINIERPDVSFVAGVSVNDKEAFGKLLALMEKQMPGADRATPRVAYELADQWFVASNSQATLDQFKAGNGNPSYGSKLTGHQSAFFFDISRLLNRIKAASADAGKNMDDMEKLMLESSIATWQDLHAWSDVKDGQMTYHAEVNMVDKNTNSLKQLNKYLGDIAVQSMKRNQEMYNDMTVTDSIVVEPAKP